MDLTGWSVLLLALKWVFIGLVYFGLFVILFAVRREMAMRVGSSQSNPLTAAGRLRVLRNGMNAQTPPGSILNLEPETTFGARRDNDIILKDPYISGHHARLNWDGASWWVVDLGSKNGTQVNGVPCPAMQPQLLPAGATLQLGDMAFELLE